jgi:hypothetical protein
MMKRAAFWGPTAVLSAALVAASAPARAGDISTREAEARFQEGLARVKSHDFEAARVSFAQAYAVLHRPQILWNLALAEEKTARVVEALQHFRAVADDASAGPDRANAQRHVDSLMALTGHIEVKAPAGAQVSIDGSTVFTAPLASAIDVVPGRHVVDADVAVGPRSKPVEVAEGQVAHLDFLPPDAPAPAPPPVAPPPPPLSEAPPAPVRAAEAPSDAVTYGSSSPARTITTASLGGAAVVAIGLGIYFGLQSRSEASSVNGYLSDHASSYCTAQATASSSTCTQWNNAYQAQNRDGVVSDVAYVAGGVFAAAAAATWFLWPRESHGSAAWVLPEAGPSSAGLRAGVSF